MDKKSRLYVSLPITGHDMAEVRKRCDAAKEKYIREYDVVTPIDLCGGDVRLPYSWCMGKCVEAFLTSRLLAGWHDSRGCTAEFEIARIYGLSIMFA